MGRSSRTYRWIQKRETEASKKLLFSIIVAIVFFIFFFTIGIQILAKFAESLSFLSKNNQVDTNTQIFSPRLDHIPEATNQSRLEISGYAQSGDTVSIRGNGREKTSVVTGSDGRFEATIELDKDSNKITAVAKDQSGHQSNESTEMKIVYDRTPPSLTLFEPSAGQTFHGDQKSAHLSGQTEPAASVVVNDVSVPINQNGTFSYSISLTPGDNPIKITATDTAGNKTTTNLSVGYSP